MVIFSFNLILMKLKYIADIPMPVLSELEQVIRPRRHFTKRRKIKESSSDSSTDSEDLVRKPSKYRTNK